MNPVTVFGRVLRRPVLRRVLPAMLLSAIGDGMSVVAVALLAARIAPPGQSGVWTGLAVARSGPPSGSAPSSAAWAPACSDGGPCGPW
jgi:hypothetical protein